MINENNQRALLNHIINNMQEQRKKALSGAEHERLDNEVIRMTETRIYIGLNDAETKKQKYETEKYLGVLKKVCQSYHVAFSVDIEAGGYFHEDGTYTEETSFVLLLIAVERGIVQRIAKDLCVFFNQEAVLVTENHIEGYLVNK